MAVGAVLLILNFTIVTTQAVEEGEVDVVGINSLAVGSERIVDLVVVVTWGVSGGSLKRWNIQDDEIYWSDAGVMYLPRRRRL